MATNAGETPLAIGRAEFGDERVAVAGRFRRPASRGIRTSVRVVESADVERGDLLHVVLS